MFEQDLAKFANLMVTIGEVYSKPFTPAVIDIYWNLLKEYRFEEISAAVKCHLENPEFGKYLPKPSDLIMAIDGNPHNQSLRAWSKVSNAIRHVGRYASVAFDDPLIHAVIKDMGGWVRICNIEDKQSLFVIKEFLEHYRGYVAEKPTSYPKYLVGAIEGKNRASGCKYDPPILIGDEAKAKEVIANGDHLLTHNNSLFFSSSSSTSKTALIKPM